MRFYCPEFTVLCLGYDAHGLIIMNRSIDMVKLSENVCIAILIPSSPLNNQNANPVSYGYQKYKFVTKMLHLKKKTYSFKLNLE